MRLLSECFAVFLKNFFMNLFIWYSGAFKKIRSLRNECRETSEQETFILKSHANPNSFQILIWTSIKKIRQNTPLSDFFTIYLNLEYVLEIVGGF